MGDSQTEFGAAGFVRKFYLWLLLHMSLRRTYLQVTNI